MNKIEEIAEQLSFDNRTKVAAKCAIEFVIENPSEFGLVSREESDKLAEALRDITLMSPGMAEYFMQHNYRELYGMYRDRILPIAQQTLTEYEKLK